MRPPRSPPQPYGRVTPGGGQLGGAPNIHPVLTRDACRGERVGGGHVPAPRRRGHAAPLRHGKVRNAVAGPRPDLVVSEVPVEVLEPAQRGACADAVLSVGALLSLQGTAPEVLLALPNYPGAIPRI